MEDVVRQNINNFKKYTFLLEQLVKKEIKLKYRSSVLGVLWTLLEPLLTMIVLSYVFSVLFNKKMEYVPVYILSGRLLYTFFANSTKAATKSIRKNGAMIKKVYVPKYIYALASVIANYIMFLISLSILAVIFLIIRVPITWNLLLLFIPLGIIFVMTLGIGLILATAAVFFRDLEYLWSVALMIIMYTAAIFYDTSRIIDENRGWIFKVNPLYAVIHNFRACLFGEALDPYYLIYSIVFSIVTLGIGMYVFYKKQDKFILNI